MKKLFTCLLPLIMVTVNNYAQIVNINPDPNDDPWIAGDAILTPPEIEETVPSMVLTAESAATQLPEIVDNSLLDYMPPVFHQKGSASCVQVAELWCTFAYEINRLRGLSGGDEIGDEYKDNQYHPFYSYNFFNDGIGSSYTSYKSGFQLIKESGCPSYEVYDDPAIEWTSPTKYKYWMNEHDNYNNSMDNKIDDYEYINWNNSYESLDTLKHWLSDHNSGDDDGGLAIISVLVSGWYTLFKFQPGTPEAGKYYVSQWGNSGGHALTIVGYRNDVHCFDIDGDGEYNNADIDGDGVIEIDECEKGAFKVVNSYGADWRNDGYIYVPYKLMASGLQVNKKAYKCDVQDEYESLLTVKPVVEYPARDELKFKVGYAENASQTQPLESTQFKSFKYQGGSNEMRGAYQGPIEAGLDFWEKYSDTDFGKIFFSVTKNVNSANEGTIDNFLIVDYRWGEEFELSCDESNVAIINDDETILSIEYDLIPHEGNITSNTSFNTNMVSRFTPTVSNNAVLNIANEIRIDMYDSEITINPWSSLVLGDNVTIVAKRGNCKLIIDGNLTIGNNVNFVAEDGAELEVLLSNYYLQAAFDNTTFDGSILNSYAQSLTITNSTFNDCFIAYSHRGNVNVSENTSFYRTWLYLEDQSSGHNFTANVNNCTFSTDYTMVAIDIWNYDNFYIQYNTINGYYNGIQLMQSGGGLPGNQSIFGNEIFNSTKSGIAVFNSTASISSNYLHDNLWGLRLYDNSNVGLAGNPGATNFDDVNYITNNSSYEVYASAGSFPWYFGYNAIVDDDNLGNPTDPMVYYDPPVGGMPVLNVEYNYWGEGFVASEDLYPAGYYDWEPTWSPGGGQKSSELALQDFLEGIEQFENEEYSDARSTFESVIEEYPGTQYAEAAMKELFALEQFLNNDYTALQQYYETNDSIQADTVLAKLATFLVNKCDIVLENWTTAIDHFEAIIANPETTEDSIFAIIDLGYTYFLMENNGYKSGAVGKMPGHKPGSYEAFAVKRDYLLSLLPFEYQKEIIGDEPLQTKPAELQKIVPNPFSGTTTLHYNLKKQGNISLKVFDQLGKEVKRHDLQNQDEGPHSFKLDMSGLPPGIYFCSVYVNAYLSDTKKIVLK